MTHQFYVNTSKNERLINWPNQKFQKKRNLTEQIWHYINKERDLIKKTDEDVVKKFYENNISLNLVLTSRRKIIIEFNRILARKRCALISENYYIKVYLN